MAEQMTPTDAAMWLDQYPNLWHTDSERGVTAIATLQRHARATVETCAADIPPTIEGPAAMYHEAADHASALAIWTCDDGAVWVDTDGELNLRSRYSGHCVSAQLARLVLAAERWRERDMPARQNEVLTRVRASRQRSGTLLVRVNTDGRAHLGATVVGPDALLKAPNDALYRVLELPRGATKEPW